MVRLFALTLALGLCWTLAWAQAMTADEAYIRAVSYFQAQVNRIETDQKLERIKAHGETQAVKTQLALALKELAALKSEAAKDKSAAQALAAFGKGEAASGLDDLEAGAKARADQAVADWKRIGALAFAADPKRAVRAYQEALKLSPQDEDARARLAAVQIRTGALAEAAQSAQFLAESKDAKFRVRGLLELGRIALMQDNPARAQAFFKEALPQAEKASREEAQALSGLAAAAEALNAWPAAEGLQKEALAAFRALKDEDGEAQSLIGLAEVARARKVWSASEGYLREAEAVYERKQDAFGLAYVNLGLGEQGLIQNVPSLADMRLRAALKSFEDLGHKAGQAASLKGLGEAALRSNRPQEACLNWRRASGLYAQIGAMSGAPARETAALIAQKCR